MHSRLFPPVLLFYYLFITHLYDRFSSTKTSIRMVGTYILGITPSMCMLVLRVVRYELMKEWE